MNRLLDLHSYLFLKTTIIIIVLYVCNGDQEICQQRGVHILKSSTYL